MVNNHGSEPKCIEEFFVALEWPPIIVQMDEPENSRYSIISSAIGFRMPFGQEIAPHERTMTLTPRVNPWWESKTLPINNPRMVMAFRDLCGIDIHEMLGYRELRGLTIDVDSDLNRVRIYQGSYTPENTISEILLGWDGEAVTAQVRIQDAEEKCRLDWIRSDIGISKATFSKISSGLVCAEKEGIEVRTDGASSTVTMRYVRTIRILDEEHSGVRIYEGSPFLGIGFLRRYNFAIDFEKMQIYLTHRKANYDISTSMPFGMLGLFSKSGILVRRLDEYQILQDSLKVGDLIVAISGIDVSGRTRTDVYKSLVSCWRNGGQIKVLRNDLPVVIDVVADPQDIERRRRAFMLE
jgi:hypothetical protein